MLFPLSDDDRKLIRPTYVTVGLLVINVLVFLYQLGSPAFTLGFSVIPAEITSGKDLVGTYYTELGGSQYEIDQTPGPWPIYLTLITSMFMHADWLHLGGNMLYLWIFGDNVEHRFGSLRFLFFYIASGLVASAAQISLDPDSIIPNLGASGAISGVLGAYLVLFPRNRVYCIILFRIVALPALAVLGLWFLFQFLAGGNTLLADEQAGGVAYTAHIGGFIAGMIFGGISRIGMDEEPDTAFTRVIRDDPKDHPAYRPNPYSFKRRH